MRTKGQKCVILCSNDISGETITAASDGGVVGREERVRRVLEVLVDSGCAMPTAVIFRNAKYGGADFERRVVDSYLRELHEDGYIVKVDPDSLESREINEINLSEEGYFIATEAGRAHLEED